MYVQHGVYAARFCLSRMEKYASGCCILLTNRKGEERGKGWEFDQQLLLLSNCVHVWGGERVRERQRACVVFNTAECSALVNLNLFGSLCLNHMALCERRKTVALQNIPGLIPGIQALSWCPRWLHWLSTLRSPYCWSSKLTSIQSIIKIWAFW